MFRNTLCAFLAPAIASAMAMPWAGPEPTMFVPDIDGWSPAPTPAPQAQFLEVLKRQDVPGDNTCGYLSASSLRSLTCVNANYVCATNSFYGVHGCCDPLTMSSCSIPTTCIPSSQLAVSCTGGCSANSYIAKCTNALNPYCYEWLYVYPGNTIMTEYGCASLDFTSTVSRFYSGQIVPGGSSADPTISYVTVLPTTTSESSSSSESSETPTPTIIPEPANGGGKKKKAPVGAIAGGVVGGVVVLGALGAGLRNPNPNHHPGARNRKKKRNATGIVPAPHALGAEPQMGQMGPAPGVTEFKPQAPPQGFPPSPGQQYADPAAPAGVAGGYYTSDNKTGFHQERDVPQGQEVGSMAHPYSPPMTPAPQYSVPIVPQVAGVPAGVAEAGGEEVHPGAHRESIQSGGHRESVQSGPHRESVQSNYQPGPGPQATFLNQSGPGAQQHHQNGPIYEVP